MSVCCVASEPDINNNYFQYLDTCTFAFCIMRTEEAKVSQEGYGTNISGINSKTNYLKVLAFTWFVDSPRGFGMKNYLVL